MDPSSRFQGAVVPQHPLLRTKLYVPSIRPELVPRPRLIERVNEGLDRKLTLVSSPAGFGKTTLASEWVQVPRGATPPVAIAWLSLDEGDNDLNRFLAYLLAALQTVEGDLGQGVVAALQSPGSVVVFVLGMITGAALAHNFTLAGSPDAVVEGVQKVVILGRGLCVVLGLTMRQEVEG